ncbi:MAG TPA: hypothetical protein VNB24_03085 [Acidimicrobiales bacterium]|nr:hypothetical protein [Acidimicrobiales bacterium]
MRRWGIGLVALAVLLTGSLADPARAAGYAPATVAFTFADDRINESSGVAAASLTPGVIFTHNDSGDAARFFAVGSAGQTLAIYTVAGAGAIDWEEMARGPASSGSGSSLYFADIGNNFRTRRVLTIYEVAEPVVVPGQDATLPIAATRHLSYEDIPHDAEAFFVHPVTRELVIVAKEVHGLSNVYVAQGTTLVRVATVPMPLAMTPGTTAALVPLGEMEITGGAINDAGTTIVLRTYVEALEWRVSDSYAATFAAAPARIALPKTTQGEAITYTPGGGLLTTTEGVRGPVHVLAPR